MIRIVVSQFIYGNVSKEQSLSKQRGFQTLFYTHADISEPELRVLEERAQVFSPKINQVKYQFFMLPTGKAVVSQITPVKEVDGAGSNGNYLAHSLVISATHFKSIDCCPLPVISPEWFFSNLEEVYEKGELATGNISSKALMTELIWERAVLKAAQEWPDEQLLHLARLGWQATWLAEKRHSVGIVGDLRTVLQTLAVIFLLTPPPRRPLLSFDTNASGCDRKRDWPFWATGIPGTERVSQNIVVTPAAHQVRPSLSAERDGPFERWVIERALPSHLEDFLQYRNHAVQLEEVLNKKQNLRKVVDGMDTEFAQQFTRLNLTLVVEQVLSHMPAGLSRQTLQRIEKEVRAEPWEFLVWIQRGSTPDSLSQLFYQLILGEFKVPLTEGDYKVLTQLANKAINSPLQGILKLHKRDVPGWQKHLEGLVEPREYHEQVQALLQEQVISISQAFHPSQIGPWGQEAARNWRPGELAPVLKQLDRYKGEFEADELAGLLPALSPEEQQLLKRWVKDYAGPAPLLRSKLGLPEKAETGLVSKLKNILPH